MKDTLVKCWIIIATFILWGIGYELHEQNRLAEKELMLHQMEIISNLCENKSGSVDFVKGDLICNSKKQAETKKFRSSVMPSEI